MSYIPEVEAAGNPPGVFTGNALRFATAKEAESYVLDLAMRWTAVKDTRVVESTDPVTHVWTENGLRSIDKPEGSERMPPRSVSL